MNVEKLRVPRDYISILRINIFLLRLYGTNQQTFNPHFQHERMEKLEQSKSRKQYTRTSTYFILLYAYKMYIHTHKHITHTYTSRTTKISVSHHPVHSDRVRKRERCTHAHTFETPTTRTCSSPSNSRAHKTMSVHICVGGFDNVGTLLVCKRNTRLIVTTHKSLVHTTSQLFVNS